MILTATGRLASQYVAPLEDSWLHPEIVQMYSEAGFRQLYYFRAIGLVHLAENMETVISDVSAKREVDRHRLALVLDMSTEGPPDSGVRPLVRRSPQQTPAR